MQTHAVFFDVGRGGEYAKVQHRKGIKSVISSHMLILIRFIFISS